MVSGKVEPAPTTSVVPSDATSPFVIPELDRKLSYTSIKTKYGPPAAQGTLDYKPGKWDMWVLGMTIVMGGQYIGWNGGLTNDPAHFIAAYFLVGTGYITLCCCISELAGSLPFAGGAYGIARCTLGFFPAFLIGCFEATVYIMLAAYSMVLVGGMLSALEPSIDAYRPLIYAVLYLTGLAVNIVGDTPFWGSNVAMGLLSLLILLIYCFGAIPYADFGKYNQANALHLAGGFSGFMQVMPRASRFFMGIESVDLACERVVKPKLWIPFGQMTGMVTLFVTGAMVLFVSLSLPPGESPLAASLSPFNICFMRLFKISYNSATLLSLPATYASGFGFIWAYGKILSGMSFSKLLPQICAKCSRRTGTPMGAAICGSIFGYAMCLVIYFAPEQNQYLYSICLMFAFTSYIGQCIGYISLKINYPNLTGSNFRSPFGIAGAAYSLCVWLLCFVAVIGFQGNNGKEFVCYIVIVAIMAAIYQGYSKKRQTFSAAENRIMLVAHVMKFNVKRAHNTNHTHNNNKKAGASASKNTSTPPDVGPLESATKGASKVSKGSKKSNPPKPSKGPTGPALSNI